MTQKITLQNTSSEDFQKIIRQCCFEIVHQSLQTQNKECQDFTVAIVDRLKALEMEQTK